MTIPPSAARPDTTGRTVGETGEFQVIAEMVRRLTRGEATLVGPGDDAAEVRLAGPRALVATDMLVDGRHFRRDWASGRDVGRRAAAQSLSDINAMGGVAAAVTVAVSAPPDLPVAWLVELCDGLVAECDLVGAAVVGGDLTRSDVVTLCVTAVGSADGEPVLRSGARPGDVLAIRGRQGWAAGGLAVLQRGFRSPRRLVEAYQRPEVPYSAGPEAKALGATAMIDVSDGLVADVAHLAEASGVAVDVRRSDLVVDEPLLAVSAALNADPVDFVLTGGDDHPVVATFPEGTELPAGWTVIGAVSEGEGVTVDGTAYAGTPGYRHF